MPSFRCTDSDCGHTWFQKSILDDTPECEECGEPATMFDPDDDDDAVPEHETSSVSAAPRIAFARGVARNRIEAVAITAPPVDVWELATGDGLTIVLKRTLGSLQGRLLESTIEVAKDALPVVQRFTIAHELGHRALGHERGAGRSAEVEADNYANELLVPGPMLHDAMKTTTSSRELRKLFVVSRPVIEIACRYHRCFEALTD